MERHLVNNDNEGIDPQAITEHAGEMGREELLYYYLELKGELVLQCHGGFDNEQLHHLLPVQGNRSRQLQVCNRASDVLIL